HLRALIPGQAAPHEVRQTRDVVDHHVGDRGGLTPVRQADQQRVATGPVDQGHRGAGTVFADDQIAFPPARNAPIGRLVWAVIDADHPYYPGRPVTDPGAWFAAGAFGLQQDALGGELALG